MRLLLVESDPEDILFLRDAVMEIGEGDYGRDWVDVEILHANCWSEASAIVAQEHVDVVLLDLELPDSRGVETFRHAQQAAPAIPLVLLIERFDQSLGVQLVREGAQDFLVKRDLDCAQLAHAMRNAMERQRLLSAARAFSTRDPFTGFLNRAGFLMFADRDRKLAAKLGCRLMVIVAEVGDTFDEQGMDLALVEAAEYLRGVAGPVDLLARISPARFAMTILESEAEPLEKAWVKIHSALIPYRIRVGASLFSPEDHVTMDALLEQAVEDLSPNALAAGR